MIQLPYRNVTRFFIPWVDVLTLLFCVFLIMQAVRGPETTGGPDTQLSAEELAERSRQERLRLQELRADAAQEQARLEILRQQKTALLHQNLAIHVLEIDPRNGELVYFAPERQVIDSSEAAQAYIRQRQKQNPAKEAYFIILYPRQRTGFPVFGQIQNYRQWFASVPYAIDVPAQ